MKRQKIKQILNSQDFDTVVTVMGWVKTKRDSKKFSFVEINDGSTVKNLQVFIDHSTHDLELIHAISTGSCISIKGILVQSQGKGQTHEVQSRNIEVFGLADPEEFPLQKKAHSLEFLREISHFRPRTSTFSCVLRLRHAMAFAIHKYFNDRGFCYVHSPIITASDCEGAGEMFQVSTLNLKETPKNKETGEVDFSQDFFGKAAHLTVSGQLQAELAAMALAEVYTFGPTFRAENSNTARHLAEFWMVEPEVAFADLEDNMNLAEEFLKHCIQYALENNRSDLEFLQEKYDPELISRLEFVLNNPFVRLTYTEAIEILIGSRKQFEYPVSWGLDLQSEHERYLVEEHFKKPVILTDYPKDIKAFYMKQNADGKTVRAMDVLFPRIGEIIGGSQREEDLQKLITRIREMQLPEENYWWYLDTRRFGTAPHAGFGMGFERLLIFITGMTNIRDVIPFPRYPQHCDF